ncbi:MlaC/ttg2D family ABC transporter substrate-binding protein [Sphingomonas solaris]|uniref:ABC transporter substrate-binding protein n=1 Tax=Alterirhizorhabdus solaris TaxID=2529389 RepID=A0A558QWP0_9SPHN|nr:ABC transporter substrate-binding protein [Sphingomonas solaris]TVV71561.1 ABC transporter substrate-binding protein [Sphingomonas solaris]
MISFVTLARSALLPALLATASLTAPAFVAPAAAAVNTQEPGAFVDTLADEGFAVLRTGSRAAARSQFQSLLTQHFAVDQIGDRLIRRWRPKITPAQYASYKAAFPNFIIGTYADRLFDYARADLKLVRTVPQGTSAAVMTQVTKPGSSPINAVWTVDRVGGGYKVTNLTVAGINLAVTQAADFDAYIQRNGFDKLVAFMKSRG